MKVKDKYFTIEKIEKYLKEDIFNTRILEKIKIDNWGYVENHFDEKMDYKEIVNLEDSNWKKYQLEDKWGGYDKVAWFRKIVEIPNEWKDDKVALSLLLGPRDGGESTAEGLVYINGKPVQAIDIWHQELVIPKHIFEENNKIDIAIKVWSGVLEPPKNRRFMFAELQLIDEKVEKFYFVMDTLVRCVKLMDDNDLRKIKLINNLNDTINLVNFLNIGERKEDYYNSIYLALGNIENILEEYKGVPEIKPTVQGIGHSHIDMAWLWRLGATREKASRTFSTVLNLMEQYPDYKFFHSSPQLYKFLKADYPEIYEKVKEKIKEGRWEIDGGMWIESDTNIPSGESLVRQFMYGKRYIKEEFGLDSELLWLPDVFGYSAALPQIMKKSGIKYFMTTKISWNQYNHFPYDTFLWSGIDRTEMFTHFITTPEDGSWFYTYNGKMDPEDVIGVWENYKEKDKNSDLLITFGWGDGGGGPTKEMLEQVKVMENIPGIPYVKIDSAKSYFEKIHKNMDLDNINKWQGELYFEYHRGTYTTQGKTKWYNRKIENLLHNYEFLLSLQKSINNKFEFNKIELDEIWERVLLLQFHDVLPGTSIREVYEESEKDYEKIMNKLNALIQCNLAEISNVVCNEGLVVFNTLGFVRSDYLYLSYSDKITKDTVVIDGDKIISENTASGIVCYVENIPSYGVKKLKLQAKTEEIKNIDLVEENNSFCNEFFELKLNEQGEISYLFDKKNNKIVSDKIKPMNQFVAYEDKPQRFDAWDIDIYYKQKPYEAFKLLSRKVIENNSIRTVVAQEWQFNNSTLKQNLIIYNKSGRIDFETIVDWKESQVLLKTYFPLSVYSDEATFEIQFGNIKRTTHNNTNEDFAKFEVCGHRFVDISENDYGVSILNDSKYGYDTESNRIGLTLIKSPIRPDKLADKTTHYFTYSIYPHQKNVLSSDVQYEALKLNCPLLYNVNNSYKGNDEGYGFESFIECADSNVIVDTVKIGEDGNSIIVRLYEYRNQHNENCKLTINNVKIVSVFETNLLEENEEEINTRDNIITYEIKPYEIKTFKIIFGN